MFELLDQIGNDIKDAMKSQDKAKMNALRYLKSMLLENKTSKSPKAELDVVIGLHKKLKDGMETFPEGHPEREKTQQEMLILEGYMPKAMSEDEVKKIIQDIKAKLPAGAPVNMGMIMKELTPQIKGRFDGKLASQLVNEALKS